MVLPKKYWKKMMKKKEKEKENIMISSKKEKTTMDIPNDLIIDIFLRLPVQSLLRFRWLCKSCFNIIRDASFVNMQFNNNIGHKPNNNPLVLIYTYAYDIPHNNNLKFNSYNIMDDIEDDLTLLLCPNSSVSVKGPSLKSFYDVYNILGSCNGLLCMGVNTSVIDCERYFIWNPCTKEYKMASRRMLTENDCSYYSYNRYGFGYDRTIDDYKLVKTTVNRCNGYENRETWVNVYTLGTNRWKTVRSTHQFILCNTHEEGKINGLFISGHLYYTAKNFSLRTFDIIVSFDIAKEEYRQIPIPDKVGISHPVMNLGELKGCLCLLSCSTVLNGLWEVWMMRHNVENDIDVKEEYTWEKLYTINSVQGAWSYALNTKLLRIYKNGEILMLMEEHSYNKNGDILMVMEENSYKNMNKKKIVFYDPKSGEFTVLREVGCEGSAENYIESLLSLNSGTYLK